MYLLETNISSIRDMSWILAGKLVLQSKILVCFSILKTCSHVHTYDKNLITEAHDIKVGLIDIKVVP